MITLGVGTGEEAAPIQVGRLFDMIALRVDAVVGGGWGAAPLIREERLFDMIALEGALRGALIGERSACLPQKPRRWALIQGRERIRAKALI